MKDEEGECGKYEKLVLSQLSGHGLQLTAIEARLTSIEINIGIIKAKAAVWGAAAGAILSLLIAALFHALRLL